MKYEIIIAIIGVLAAVISAVTALIASTFARRVHKDTLSLIAPKERPIIVLTDEFSGNIFVSREYDEWVFPLVYKLKNSGERPATDLKIKYGLAQFEKPETFHEIQEPITNSNPFYPGTQIEMREYLPIKFLTGDIGNPSELLMLIYIRIEYKDKWNPDKSYSDDFYFTHENDIGTISHSTELIRERFIESVDDVFGTLQL